MAPISIFQVSILSKKLPTANKKSRVFPLCFDFLYTIFKSSISKCIYFKCVLEGDTLRWYVQQREWCQGNDLP